MNITIELSTGKKLELTLDELNELRAELVGMEPETKREYIPLPFPYPSQPTQPYTPYITRTVDGTGDSIPRPTYTISMGAFDKGVSSKAFDES